MRLIRSAFLCILLSIAVILTVALLPIVLPVMAITWVFDRVTGRHRWRCDERRRMVEQRPPLTDGEYLNQLGVPGDQGKWWIAFRNSAASQCGIPPSAIYLDDDPAKLNKLAFVGLLDGFDVQEFVFSVEKELGTKVDQRKLALGPSWPNTTFRAMATPFVSAMIEGEIPTGTTSSDRA